MSRFAFGLALLLSAPLAAQTPSDLPRIGDRITAQEAEYFGLFPSAGVVESATVTRNGAATRVVIQREVRPDTTVELSRDQVDVLEQYLLLFEDVEAVGEIDLVPLDGLFRYRKRRFEPGTVTVDVLDGPELTGDLLFADERALVLWTGERPYVWQLAEDPALVVLRWDEVEEVYTTATRLQDRSRRFAYGVGVGGLHVLAGTGAGLAGDAGFLGGLPSIASATAGAALAFGPLGKTDGLYVGGSRAGAREAAAALSRPTDLLRGPAFPAILPPEIHARLPATATGQEVEVSRRVSSSTKRFHFGLNTAYLAPVSGNFEGTYVTGSSREAMDDVSGPLTAFHLDAAYSLTRRLRLGLSSRLEFLADPAPFSGSASASSIAPFLSFAVLLPSGRMGAFSDRFELSLGGGVAFNRSQITIPFEFPSSVQALDPTLPSRLEVGASSTGVGPYARADLSFYTTPSSAVFLGLGFRSLPEVTFQGDERSYAIGTSSGLIYSYETFSQTPQQFEVIVGVSWHL